MEYDVNGKEKIKIVWEDGGRTKLAYGHLLEDTEFERKILPINKDGTLSKIPITVGKRATTQTTPWDGTNPFRRRSR